MRRITPFLWFDDQAEEAVKFYLSVFRNSKMGRTLRGPNGSFLSIAFELDGEAFVALNGGPQFKFTEAVSFVVNCESQSEVDYYWEKLSAGGHESMCGWLKDKYGLSWQIVPEALPRLLTDPDPAKARSAMAAMMQMRKIDIAALERAANAERSAA